MTKEVKGLNTWKFIINRIIMSNNLKIDDLKKRIIIKQGKENSNVNIDLLNTPIYLK